MKRIKTTSFYFGLKLVPIQKTLALGKYYHIVLEIFLLKLIQVETEIFMSD